MRNFLKGKKLYGYFARTCEQPKSTDKNYVADSKQCKHYYLD